MPHRSPAAQKLQRALVDCMILSSAADSKIRTRETQMIGSEALRLPVFKGFDIEHLPDLMDDCLLRLSQAESIENLLDSIIVDIPSDVRETAYALALDIVAVNMRASQEELNFLQILRQKLGLDRLICAGIERGARARFHIPQLFHTH